METYFVKIDIPSRLIPSQLCHLEKHSIFLFASKTLFLCNEQLELPSLGVLIYGEKELLTKEYIGKVLHEIVTLMGCTLFDYNAYSGLKKQWIKLMHIEKDLQQTIDPLSEVKRFELINPHAETPLHSMIMIVRDFHDIPIYAIYPETKTEIPKISIIRALNIFLDIDSDNKFKNLFKLFYLATAMQQIMGKFYNNVNLKPSLLFAVLESMLPSVMEEKEIACSKCGNIDKEKVNLSIKKRIDRYFLENIQMEESHKAKLIESSKLIYTQARCKFFHHAKYDDYHSVINTLSDEIGGDSMSFEDQLEHKEARFSGADALEHFLRQVLFFELFRL